jgi:hypothetical protein
MMLTRTIHLREDLCRRLEERFASPERCDVEAILTFVAMELLKEESRELDEREEQLLKSRLRDLGYL